MLHVLKGEVFIHDGVAGRGGGELDPLFLIFLDLALLHTFLKVTVEI